MVWCFSRTSRTGPGSDCRATKVNERLTRGKPRDVASGASSASASPLYRARRAIGLRPAAPEGGPRYLFARIEPPVMATAYARGVSFWNFLDFFGAWTPAAAVIC